MMKSTVRIALLAALLFGSLNSKTAQAHCEIPCGIFDDHLRIHMMDEQIATIKKCMAMIQALSDEKKSAQTTNQIVRWVDLKEKQATQIQEIVSQYYLAQRIKPEMGKAAYEDLLKKAHELIVNAMRSKQMVDQGIVDDLQASLRSFETAYNKAIKSKKK
jgi:nickel superoxide dismutase